MPKRLRPQHQEEVRAKIQASMLINRLTKCAMGEIKMTGDQIRAAEILLKKSVPDLQAVQLSGDVENPVKAVTEIRLVPLDGSRDDCPPA